MRRCFGASLAIAAVLAGQPVGAAICDDPAYLSSTSETRLTIYGFTYSDFDYQDGGAPATSIRSDLGQLVDISYNFAASSAMTQANGSFDLDTSVSGSSDILGGTSHGANANVNGALGDCLTFGGHVGTGVAHLPLRLTGSASLGWSVAAGSQYVPPNGFSLAEVQFRITCGVQDPNGFPDCPDLEQYWFSNQTVDTTFDVTFPFTFGTPIGIALLTSIGSRASYAANGSTGHFDGFANVAIDGEFGPLTVTNGGAPLANVTVTSKSGHDYLNAPEPGAAAGIAAALIALAWRRRAP